MKSHQLSWEKDQQYSDEEINELAAWLEELTLRQIFFIRDSYEALLEAEAHKVGQNYVC